MLLGMTDGVQIDRHYKILPFRPKLAHLQHLFKVYTQPLQQS